MAQETVEWDKPKKEETVEWDKPQEYTTGDKISATALATLTGLASPFAGAAQWLGYNKPARELKNISDYTKEVAGTPASVAELTGEVLSPMPTKLASWAAKGVKEIPKIANSVFARGAAQGMAGSFLNPLDLPEDQSYTDFLKFKAQEMGKSGVFGAGMGKLGQTIMSPQVSEKVQMLKDLGMRYFTPGQLASQIPLFGKALREGEAKSTSIPFVGSAIERGIKISAEDMNKAMANKVLANMNERLPKDMKAGDDMINFLNERISNAYDVITPKLQISNVPYKSQTSSTGFTTTTKALVDKLRDVTKDLPSDPKYNLAGMVSNEFQKHILSPLTKKGMLTGEEFRNAEKNLGNVAYQYIKNPELHDVGIALRQLQGELRSELIYQNPHLAKELRGIHNAFIQHLPIERAAGYLGAEGRVFSPSQLESGVRATTKGKGSFASGQGAFYPESQAALDVLGKRIPDSGTAGRLGWATLPLHGWGTVPAAAGAASIYNRPVMGALTSLATSRPAWMQNAEPRVSGALARGAGLYDYSPQKMPESKVPN